MTLKVQILQTLRRLFIILVGLTMTLFSVKMLIFNLCRRGLMPNMIKKILDGIYSFHSRNRCCIMLVSSTTYFPPLLPTFHFYCLQILSASLFLIFSPQVTSFSKNYQEFLNNCESQNKTPVKITGLEKKTYYENALMLYQCCSCPKAKDLFIKIRTRTVLTLLLFLYELL